LAKAIDRRPDRRQGAHRAEVESLFSPVINRRGQTSSFFYNGSRTGHLWRDIGDDLDEVRERFRRMVHDECADENYDSSSFAGGDRDVPRRFSGISLFWPVISADFPLSR